MDGTREAELIVRFALDGITHMLRLTGKASMNLAVFIAAALKQPNNSPGKKAIVDLLKSGETTIAFTIDSNHVKEFESEAKQYGVQYSYAYNKNEPSTIDIIVKQSQASHVNRIAEKLGEGTIQESGKIDREVAGKEDKAIRLNEYQEKMQDIQSPNQKDELDKQNPSFGVPSEYQFENSYQGLNPERKSVVQELKDISLDLDTTKSAFDIARNLRPAVIQAMPDGNEKIISDGWYPEQKTDKEGNTLFHGKKAEEFTEIDNFQYMVDEEMLTDGKLKERTISTLYENGYKVDEVGNVQPLNVRFDKKQRKQLSDIMRDPTREAAQMKESVEKFSEAFKKTQKGNTRG